MSKYFVDPNANNSRFAEDDEIKKAYSEVSFENMYTQDFNYKAGLCIIPKYDKDGNVTGFWLDGNDTNTIIVSSTGSGKTRRVLSMYMLSCTLAGESMVVHDPKGELYSFYKALLTKKGYDVRVLNLRDPMKGDRLNILEYPAKLYKAGQHGRALEIVRGIAQSIYEPLEDKDDMFWTQTSICLFSCYFVIAATLYDPEFVTLSTIYRVHIEGLEKMGDKTKMLMYLEQHKNDLCYELGIPSITAPNETRSSIFSVFTNGLSRITLNEEIGDLLTKSTFEITDFVSGTKPIALFIITRDEAPQTYSTIVAAWIDSIYSILIDEAQKRKDNRLPNSVHFILEEFGNIAKLSNVNDYMTASRSRGIRMVLVLQSLAQLCLTYSEEMAKVLVGNSQNLVYLSSTDIKLVEMISERCGKLIDPYTRELRPLLSPDRLTHLNKDKGEALMLLDRNYPYITYLPDISQCKIPGLSDTADIPKRTRLVVEHGLFSKAVEKMHDEKIDSIMSVLMNSEKNKKERRKRELKDRFAESMNEGSRDGGEIDVNLDELNEILDDIIAGD